MKQCPYCHSTHIRLLQQTELTREAAPSALANLSPMTFASIGMQMSRRLHVAPFFGGIVGLVLGGVLLLYTQQQNGRVILHYLCEQCQQSFETEQ